MSKRWKVRKQNAAKRAKSHAVMARFYDNVIAGLEQVKAHVEAEARKMGQP